MVFGVEGGAEDNLSQFLDHQITGFRSKLEEKIIHYAEILDFKILDFKIHPNGEWVEEYTWIFGWPEGQIPEFLHNV